MGPKNLYVLYSQGIVPSPKSIVLCGVDSGRGTSLARLASPSQSDYSQGQFPHLVWAILNCFHHGNRYASRNRILVCLHLCITGLEHPYLLLLRRGCGTVVRRERTRRRLDLSAWGSSLTCLMADRDCCHCNLSPGRPACRLPAAFRLASCSPLACGPLAW